MAEDAEAKALRLAAAEGLELVRSNNKTGFSNVHQYRRSASYHVESSTDGKRETLGTFATAAEAALVYARYLGPERSHALAQKPKPRAKRPARAKDDHEFGRPRIPTAASSTSHEVACVAADDDYDDEDDGVVVYAESVVADSDAGAESPSDATATPTAATAAPALKKRRVVHEYELRLGAAAGQRQVTVTIDVPHGATLGTLTAAFDVRP